MAMNRRGLLALLGAGAGAAAAPAKAATDLGWDYLHGVASGDPLQDRVIIWTRLTPQRPGLETLSCILQVATDEAMEQVIKSIKVQAGPETDWTVKVDVTGLEPGTTYFYRFWMGFDRGVLNPPISPVGRTRTLPVGATEDVILAVASCALYPQGHFNVYGAIAAQGRVDAVVHLGDYIYEYGGAGSYGEEGTEALNRRHDPAHECITLDDYRRRHAQYKTDPQLQAAHARAPWITVWDDHETCNNSWSGGGENHNPDKGEGDWAARKAAAMRAYYEWMPIREPARGRSREMANRAFQFGDIASLLMLETRLTARDEQLTYADDLPVVDGKPDIVAFKTKWLAPARRLISDDQMDWLAGQLISSLAEGRTWQVIGNQIVMGRIASPDLRAELGEEKWKAVVASLPEEIRPLIARLSGLGALGLPYNLDAWDGYPADRERVYGAFKAAGAHPLMLAGDSHTFWANELHDAGGARVAAEFATTSVTSPGPGDILADVPLNQPFMDSNKEVVFCDVAAKGFLLLTLTKESARADMIGVSTIHDPAFTTAALKSFTVTPTAGGGVSALTSI